MFLHHAADCATIVKRLLLSRLQSLNLSMYMILDINENNRKPSNDGLRLFHLFRTGSAPGGSFRFPIRWSPCGSEVFLVRGTGLELTRHHISLYYPVSKSTANKTSVEVVHVRQC